MREQSSKHSNSHEKKVENYYRFHSRIYDATRWSFLFGRATIIDMIPALPSNPRILEVGCGTGNNISPLKQRYPDAQILGVDLSGHMLDVARRKFENLPGVSFSQAQFGTSNLDEASFDVILFSYSLTMIGSNYDDLISQASQNLKPDGYAAVVDFHISPFGWFTRWMNMNHVELNGHCLPILKRHFCPLKTEINKAYLGLWSYFIFLGQKD